MFLIKHFCRIRLTRQNLHNTKIVNRLSCSSSGIGHSNAAVNDKKPFGISVNSKNNLGQPTPWTHPHLLKVGEISTGIKTDEFKERRVRLLHAVQKFSVDTQENLKNHIIVIPSAMKKYMSDKIPYVFRQHSDFFYLTGCLEPDSILVLEIDEKQNTKSTLFMRPKDKHAELWDGPRTGTENSIDFFGVDESYDISEFRNILEKKQTRTTTYPISIWYDRKGSDQKEITNILSSYVNTLDLLKSPTVFIHTLRVIKSQSEIELMRKTCQIASESINETIKETKIGDSEHHIFARMDFKCRMKDASYLAYPPVVASGNNATTIHYINNTQLTSDGDLILMDAGCEYGGYTSDITRTWPVNGKFSNEQRILYEVILLLQSDLINTLLNEGGDTLDKLFDTMCLKLGKYLQEVGLIPKDLSGTTLAKAAYKYCPHHVSHYLGLDVHDTPLISRSTKLLPGMVCTVEPGIYIDADRLDVPPEFRGIGVRIEDDILIRSNSVEVLTEKCIKNTSQIEELCRK